MAFCSLAPDMLRVWRSPGPGIVASCRVLNLDDFGAAIISISQLILNRVCCLSAGKGVPITKKLFCLPTQGLPRFVYSMAEAPISDPTSD